MKIGSVQGVVGIYSIYIIYLYLYFTTCHRCHRLFHVMAAIQTNTFFPPVFRIIFSCRYMVPLTTEKTGDIGTVRSFVSNHNHLSVTSRPVTN